MPKKPKEDYFVIRIVKLLTPVLKEAAKGYARYYVEKEMRKLNELH